MALATQCPYCQTIFRVANDQLKLRAGLVRCGSCREVFNGIEHLVRPNRVAPAPEPTAAAAADLVSSPAPENHLAEIHDDSAPAAQNHIAAVPPVPLEQEEQELKPDPVAVPAAEHLFPPIEAIELISLPQAPAPATTASVSDRVEAAIDGFEEDLRIEEEAAQAALSDHADTPDLASEFNIASTPAEPFDATLGEHHIDSSKQAAPNVWHRHADDDDANPMARMTLMHVAGQDYATSETDSNAAADDQPAAPDDDELDRLIDELQRKPWRVKKSVAPDASSSPIDLTENQGKKKSKKTVEEPEPAATDEPGFVLAARRQQRLGGLLRGGMWAGSLLLMIGLVGQSTYMFRDQLAVRLPQLKPILVGACAKIGCSVDLPMKIETISIDANELQTVDPAHNIFALNLLMRNRSDTVQAWPSVELTLNDAGDKALVRRVFTPHDYLPAASNVGQGFASDQEQAVKLTFELLQLKASGYRVYLFYP
ncbi:DUF3426 domain-containing protein [Paraherbaspirillum soli]|uniref:DUF3426 domain-containing protein n=1 Tax=Paraherbaspirillum soli TaxID=631222 RepID=A0ABW0MGS1_9BURK